MNCVCYLSEMGIRTGGIKSLGRTLFSNTLVYGKEPIDFQICLFQNGRLVAILDFLVCGFQFGFQFQIQTSAAHFLHALVNRRLVILKDVQLQSMHVLSTNTHFRCAGVS